MLCDTEHPPLSQSPARSPSDTPRCGDKGTEDPTSNGGSSSFSGADSATPLGHPSAPSQDTFDGRRAHFGGSNGGSVDCKHRHGQQSQAGKHRLSSPTRSDDVSRDRRVRQRTIC